MANVILTNWGEFSTAATDFFENNSGGAHAFASISNFWSNGAGQAYQNSNNTGAVRIFRTKNVPAQAEYFAHIRHRVPNGGAISGIICFNESGTNHINVGQNADGTIYVERGSTLIATGATVFSTLTGRILSVQVRVVIHDTTGVVQVRINGSTSNEINFSGDTRNGGTGVINQIGPLVFTSTDNPVQWADFVVNDTTGGVSDSWTGAQRVVLGAFTISGASGQQFTPLSSTNVSNIDDAVPGARDGDTTYNESSTAGHKDYFQLASSVFTGMSPASISCTRTKYWARAADGGTHTMRTGAKNGGTQVNGTTQTLGSAYELREDVFHTDPNTGVAWATFADIYGTEFDYELVS